MKKTTINEFETKKQFFNFKNISKDSKIHFIAIGGIGMSALAKIMLEAGYKVSGSDLNRNHLVEYLENKGAEIYSGHAEENIKDVALVVKSTAIRDNNPEIKAAQGNNIPILHRAELLNQIMLGLNETNEQVSIGVTGTHGKTSTTGMIALILHELGLNPGFAIGGVIPQLKTNSLFAGGKYFVSELDESDGTIQLYSPDISIITNLELEHADHYKDGFEQVLKTMEFFNNKLDKNAKVVINIDDKGNNEFLERTNNQNRFITYSLESKEADYFGSAIQTVPNAKMKVYKNTEYLGTVELGVPGIHNLSNALGAIAASMQCCSDFKKISSALAGFIGMKRRFQTLGYANGARIVDDYAHHPTEIKATVKTAKDITNLNKSGRVIAVFQPHRYTRLQNFWHEFIDSLNEADIVYVCDVYAASEDPIKDISSEEFIKQMKNMNSSHIKGALDNVAKEIIKEIQQDDIVLTMGAGTITKLGGIILDSVSDKILS